MLRTQQAVVTVRVVSLVPSLTEAVAATAPGALVGATAWCTHPPDLDARGVRRVGGTKNPDLDAVAALAPDLVVANEEENRTADLEALQSAGFEVLVTEVRTVAQALAELHRVVRALDAPTPRWLEEAAEAWEAVRPLEPRRTAVVPVWRRPWVFTGRETYAGDVLRRLGVDDVLAGHEERWPRVRLEDLPPHDLVVLPSEPYAFATHDGPEAFTAPSALVDGRLLTWYGPAMGEAPGVLRRQLAAAAQASKECSGPGKAPSRTSPA